LWLASDVISQQSEAISNQVSEAMAENKALTERIDALEKEVAKAKMTHKRSIK
jgi:dynactin complex subunit